MNDDERDRMRHTAEALRQARGRVLQGSSNFLEIVQVIETFGKEHWKKNHLACINKKLAKLIDAWNTGGSCEEVCRLLDAMREGRNEAVHEGTLGRRLARDCVRVSIMVEEALRREAEMKAVACSSHGDSSRGTFSMKRHHVVRDRNVLTIGIGQRRPRLVEA